MSLEPDGISAGVSVLIIYVHCSKEVGPLTNFFVIKITIYLFLKVFILVEGFFMRGAYSAKLFLLFSTG